MRKVMITMPVYKGRGKVQQKDTENYGMFHAWGVAYDELGEGVGNYSVALVEIQEGIILEINPAEIKFVKE